MGKLRTYAVMGLALWAGMPSPILAQPPTSSPPVGGAITHANYPLPKCTNSANFGVFWIRLPDRINSNKIRQAWHRPLPYLSGGSDPPATSALGIRNEPTATEPFDLFYKGSFLPLRGKVLVRVIIPPGADYVFYDDKAGVYGVGEVDPSSDPSKQALCQSPTNPPPGLARNVTYFMVDRHKMGKNPCVEFNIVIEPVNAVNHQGVRYLDPKIHNNGAPLIC